MRPLAALLCLAALAAAPAPGRAADQVPARDGAATTAPGRFDGRWWGQYSYDDPSRPVVTFTVDIVVSPDGRFQASLDENASDFGGPQGAKRLHATIYGTFDPATGVVDFLKVYDFDAGKQVQYHGVQNGDEVRGTWAIPGSAVTGHFFWKRAPKTPKPDPPKMPEKL